MVRRTKPGWAFGIAIACSLLFPLGSRAADTITLNITAYIDGRDQLVIHGSTMQWRHLDFCAVGIWNGANVPTTISTTLNGTVEMSNFEWTPEWPPFSPCPNDGADFPSFSSLLTTLTPALPDTGRTVTLTPIKARGTVSIAQYPTFANGHTLIVDFDDDPEPGPSTYQVEVTLSPPSTRPIMTAQVASQKQDGTLLTVFVNFSNVGSEVARNILWDTVTLSTLGGTGTVTLTTPALPLDLGIAGVGGGETVALQFNVPATVTKFGLTASGTMQDSAGHTYNFRSVPLLVTP